MPSQLGRRYMGWGLFAIRLPILVLFLVILSKPRI
jgi:hypothetical protein